MWELEGESFIEDTPRQTFFGEKWVLDYRGHELRCSRCRGDG